MSSRDQPERRRLLELVADVVIADGVHSLSLSHLARRIGSNNRMLLYYFGSKENLLDEATAVALARFPKIHGMLASLSEEGSAVDLLDQAWMRIADPESLPFLMIFFEIFALNARQPERNSRYFHRIDTAWAGAVAALLEREGFAPGRAHVASMQIVALWRGLQFAVLADSPRDALLVAYRDGVRRILAD